MVIISVGFMWGCYSDTKAVLEPSTEGVVVDGDGDGFSLEEDCDDTDDDVYPGASELCDGVDNDCNNEIDDGVLSTFYVDNDGDGFGISTGTVEACEAPEGFVPNASDCDDTAIDIYPGNVEVCDGMDNNCDGVIDEGVGDTYYRDADGDGYGGADIIFACAFEEGLSAVSEDCDDLNNTIHPEALEVCDGIDNNCNNELDEGVQNTYYADADDDGYGDVNVQLLACQLPQGFVENAHDCSDSDSLIYPGAVELCDEIDNNCNGTVDEEEALGVIVWYLDNDGDGYGQDNQSQSSCAQPSGYTANSGDCDDTDSAITPVASEICDGIDNDCDGYTDDDDPSLGGATLFYLDHDGDGYGDALWTQQACNQPAGYVLDSSDCNDLNPGSYPNASEVCDGEDNNCDGYTDDDDPSVDPSTFSSFYHDYDGDGYGDPSDVVQQCDPPSGYGTKQTTTA